MSGFGGHQIGVELMGGYIYGLHTRMQQKMSQNFVVSYKNPTLFAAQQM